MEEPKNLRQFKILLVGDSSVGKTSIMSRYANNSFPENYQTSVGVDYRIKELKRKKNKTMIQILDTGGQDKFRSVAKSFFREVNGIFIIFDLNDKDTFTGLDYWVEEVRNTVNDSKVIVLGNKSDLKEEVSDELINKFKEEKNLDIYKVSAKQNKNIKEAFEKMIHLIRHNPDADIESFSLDISKHVSMHKHKRKKRFC